MGLLGTSNAIIVHGIGGGASGNWFPWLKRELEARGCAVAVPQFPPIERHTLANWREAFAPYEGGINRDTILVGHSVGVTFLLNVLQELAAPVKACFFVSGFCSKLGNEEYDAPNRSFLDGSFDWPKILANGSRFTVLHADDDPYVPMQNARELADNLRVGLMLVPGGGHFMAESGFKAFPLLLEQIRGVL